MKPALCCCVILFCTAIWAETVVPTATSSLTQNLIAATGMPPTAKLQNLQLGADPTLIPSTPDSTTPTQDPGVQDRAYKAEQAGELDMVGGIAAASTAKNMYSAALNLMASQSPVEQQAGAILFSRSFGWAAQETAQANSDGYASQKSFAQYELLTDQDANHHIPLPKFADGAAAANVNPLAPASTPVTFDSTVQKYLSNLGIDTQQLAQDISKGDWADAQNLLAEADSTSPNFSQVEQTSALQIADKIGTDITQTAFQKASQFAQDQAPQGAPSNAPTVGSAPSLALNLNRLPVAQPSIAAIGSAQSQVPLPNRAQLETEGIQTLPPHISIFRVAQYQIQQHLGQPLYVSR